MRFDDKKRWKGRKEKGFDQATTDHCILCGIEGDHRLLMCNNRAEKCPRCECSSCVARLRPDLWARVKSDPQGTIHCLHCAATGNETGETEWITVTKEEYVRVERAVDRFPDRHSTESPDKWIANRTFSFLVGVFSDVRPGYFLVLDGTEGVTTKHTVGLGQSLSCSSGRIHIVNLHRDFAKKCAEEIRPYATIHHESYYAFVRDHQRSFAHLNDFCGFAGIAYDVCCTLQGNKWVMPLSDIEATFKHGALRRHNGVFWVTVSNRETGGNLRGLLDVIPEKVGELAFKHKYHIKPICGRTYGGQMAAVFFATSEDEVEFAQQINGLRGWVDSQRDAFRFYGMLS